jgi:hypothetical protein
LGMESLAVMRAFLLAAVVVMPAWPYSEQWGFIPAGACAADGWERPAN